MPMGTRHCETGVLRLAPRGYELHVDDGGVWALDASWRARKLVGRRVAVKGVRSGFDRLDVNHIKLMDSELSGSPRSCWKRLFA